MKITKEQYDRAKKSLPKLQKAQEIVTAWEKAVAGETREVSRVQITPSGAEVTYKKEVPGAQGGSGRGAA